MIEGQITSRTYTFVVAASDSPAKTKQGADYICDGTADDVQIQAAHDAIDPDIGGKIHLSSGTFNIIQPLVFDRMIAFEGEGAAQTVIFLVDGSDCNMIELADPGVHPAKNVFSSFRHFRLNGNKDNNTGSLYGIIQQAIASPTYGWVDIQFEDLWIDRINGSGISLRNKWDHCIRRNAFEHLDGAAIELNLPTGTSLLGLWIQDNFTLDIAQFIKRGADVDADEKIMGLVLSGNHATAGVRTADAHFVDLPPVYNARIINNFFQANHATADTYAVLKMDFTTLGIDALAVNALVADNVISDGANGAKYGIWIQPYTVSGKILKGFKVKGNTITAGDTYGFMSSETAFRYLTDVAISDNTFINPGNGIYINWNGGMVTNNYLYPGGTYSIHNKYGYQVTVKGNNVSKPIEYSYAHAGGMAIRDNEGAGMKQIATAGSPTLQTWGYVELDSSGGAITATLPDIAGSEQGSLNPVGAQITIVMTEASTSSTVSVTNHETDNPEVGTFDAVGETWVLIWTGTEWATLKATCTF